MSTEPTSQGWPWSGIDPAAWDAHLGESLRARAPEPDPAILPGWTVTINGINSSAPQTEVEVLQRHSYGRQLGRIADALQALLEERGQEAPMTSATGSSRR